MMQRLLCVSISCCAMILACGAAWSMTEIYTVHPVGKVVKTPQETVLELFPGYRDALLGLDGFSHIIILYWFDRNDTPEKRATLRVHPRADKRNPLTGVFGTRAPVRPNPIGLTVCKIKRVESGRIIIDEIDAFDQTPILDIKPYIPAGDAVPEASVPAWLRDASGRSTHDDTGCE